MNRSFESSSRRLSIWVFWNWEFSDRDGNLAQAITGLRIEWIGIGIWGLGFGENDLLVLDWKSRSPSLGNAPDLRLA